MDEPKRYQSQPIPSRDELDGMRNAPEERAGKGEEKAPWEIKFAEILLESGRIPGAAESLSPENIQEAPDRKRDRFYEMRQIARRDPSCLGNPSKIFYEQARMMENFTDDYPGQAPFSFYFPYYQLMGYGQLRTYFTWRTRVRAGDIQSTCVSYAFVYIYELLACIGAKDPSESIQRLLHFWRTYRNLDKTIDKYVLQWIKDFYVYYPMETSFAEFAAQEKLLKYYPKVSAYMSGKEESFSVFAELSKYDIRKSIFYTDETKLLMGDCFYFLLSYFRRLCRDKNKIFEDFVFYPIQKESDWKPFSGALFYPYLAQEDRTVQLSPREGYTCTQGRWTYHSVLLKDEGKCLIGYIMKEMESALRTALHFRYKLRNSPDMCSPKILKRLQSVGISLPEQITEGVRAFLALRNRTEVRVDTRTVSRIRREALETQDKLIVLEEEEETAVVEETVVPAPAPLAEENPWRQLVSSLTEPETAALQAALKGKSVKKVAIDSGIMLEVLLDGVNSKAMDIIGDTILETDDTAIVYEEYKEKLMEVVDY